MAFASFIGSAIEFYDFYIYGTAAVSALTIASKLPILTRASWSIYHYMTLMAVLGSVSVYFLSEIYLSEVRTEERRLLAEEGVATAE